MGTAGTYGELWGARARDWADVQEPSVTAVYEAVLRKLHVGPDSTLLDVGCGAGLFCVLAAQLGATIKGLDAAQGLIEIAIERVPQGDFRVGEMEELPFASQTFDVVTGFNSFQFAANPVNALSEARRVARAGAPVVITVWGKAEDCEAAACLGAVAALLPPPPGTPGPFALSEEGALEALVSEAGLVPMESAEVDTLWQYPDEETALRGLLSAGPAARAIRNVGEQRVVETVREALIPFKTSSGGYELSNRFRYLIAVSE
ncbi:MAG: class I SAM-dependent methyltransferase [Acidiferrobacterales bacterium]